ncbi:MAG: DUF4252 domain-containing protein [Saprospiraceae bacterium]|nr:DUF4252 domain-containing protein [Bacteroidia bacterium]NNK89813.1 DUF4252 domain-containing protein [Saprospiraceae bacterium]
MRNILVAFILICFVGSVSGQKNAIDKYFNQYKDDERFTMVYISPKMFEMAVKVAEENVDEEVVEMLKEIEGLKILTTDTDPNNFYKEALKKINTKEYEELMTVRDQGQNVQFLVKDQQNGDIVNELLLLVGGDDEFVLMSFVGKINLNKIGKLAKNMSINGTEHLMKLDKEE